ncbi:MAG: cobalamin biosynthesis protein [Gammaproteobacteria bacterium]|nr:cobalamin biosynthesis protein [Gammaproteobacteria bacterium]NIR98768.1 cobalamin biosynthesis protein [Gammaproteobacteria bacterium]NIT64478.1 cobalamin biosynthesis protein [Gammaproteobacteria bacterium]NIV21398.1 cobalamin biosynthesis protein [Gammaproteobacteria bacterium]NIX11268.1 cobalamin biosynthesis protein [Gammaproteobacteria bacterium]
MKVAICAGPPTSGKTTVLKQAARKLIQRGRRLAYLKIDVQYADEDEMFRDLGVPARKLYSGDLCPDHCSVLVLGDAIEWARDEGADALIVETAGLCLRCAPYIEGALGLVVLEATSGMNLPRKIGAMLTLADLAVLTKIDLVSQAEREVFRANIQEVTDVPVVETDALHGINIDPLVGRIERVEPVGESLMLKGSPPVATCTICVGKKEIGWEKHFGVVRTLDSDLFYRGQ